MDRKARRILPDELRRVVHTNPPVYNARSRVLILGTMPSPQSRERGFYYAHPQNRFWRVLAAVMDQPLPADNEEKRRFLLDNGIAVWDVLHACTIRGADDASIGAPVFNDFAPLFAAADIRAIFTTGKKAFDLYRRHCVSERFPMEPHPLPSTSPANASFSLERLVERYRVLRDYLDVDGASSI